MKSSVLTLVAAAATFATVSGESVTNTPAGTSLTITWTLTPKSTLSGTKTNVACDTTTGLLTGEDSTSSSGVSDVGNCMSCCYLDPDCTSFRFKAKTAQCQWFTGDVSRSSSTNWVAYEIQTNAPTSTPTLAPTNSPIAPTVPPTRDGFEVTCPGELAVSKCKSFTSKRKCTKSPFGKNKCQWCGSECAPVGKDDMNTAFLCADSTLYNHCVACGDGSTDEICGFTPEPCSRRATFADAEKLCESTGARLCTVEEVKAGIPANSGCGMDVKDVWTSSSCSTSKKNGHSTVMFAGGRNVQFCKKDKKRASVRCCRNQN